MFRKGFAFALGWAVFQILSGAIAAVVVELLEEMEKNGTENEFVRKVNEMRNGEVHEFAKRINNLHGELTDWIRALKTTAAQRYPILSTITDDEAEYIMLHFRDRATTPQEIAEWLEKHRKEEAE